MDRIGNGAMFLGVVAGCQLACEWLNPACAVGRVSTRYDKAYFNGKTPYPKIPGRGFEQVVLVTKK